MNTGTKTTSRDRYIDPETEVMHRPPMDRGVMIYRAAKDENGKWPVTPFAHIATTFSVEQRGGSRNREDLTEVRRGFVGHA